MQQIRQNIENYAFGVCTYIGSKLNVSTGTIRLYFIYVSFLTFGSPVIIYLTIAFWLKFRHYIMARRHSVWDL